MENTKQQSAVEFAVEKLEQFIPSGNQLVIRTILEKAKEMEEQQIIDAHDNGYIDGGSGKKITAEQYYNETFKNKQNIKNIHVLPTDKPSRLYKIRLTENLQLLEKKIFISSDSLVITQNIYITSDEEIKIGDWFITDKNTICKCVKVDLKYAYSREAGSRSKKNCKKIILTTDQDLINERVQPIPDEFIEWFVQNPSFEYVEVEKMLQCRWGTDWYDLPNQKERREPDGIYQRVWKIIIPKEKGVEGINSIECCDGTEEPKQQTFEIAKEIENQKDTKYNKMLEMLKVILEGKCDIPEWKKEMAKKLIKEAT